MKITCNHLRGIIREELERVKVNGDIEQAMNKIKGRSPGVLPGSSYCELSLPFTYL
jgi:hypothetical protein